MFFKQVKMHGDNFSYVIADENTREAAVVDPGFDADEIKTLLTSENFKLTYIINTHDHIDHVVGNDALRLRFGAQAVSHRLSKITKDVQVDDGDVINVGSVAMRVLYTPGHSADSISLLVEGKKLLTGDTLYVGSVGNAPGPDGDLKSLHTSLFNNLLNLGDDVEVYPGHDRGAKSSSTLGEEKRSNKALQSRNYEEFLRLVKQH
jgi:glyoxylase-like metal-dependent hydrolase (beta-lactamase superfamily II)